MKRQNKIWVVFVAWFVMAGSIFVSQVMAQTSKNVYVADFLIDYQAVSQENDSRQGPLQKLRPGLLKTKEDPVEDAGNLAQSLAASLVDQLNAKGILTSRVSRYDRLAAQGVLVQGEFLELDEGNRLKRAAIGFGSGATEMEVKVMVSKLPLDGGGPDATFDTGSASGKGPGGLLGVAICGNPYALAAKFVLSKRASQNDVRKLASKIAKEIDVYLKQQNQGM